MINIAWFLAGFCIGCMVSGVAVWYYYDKLLIECKNNTRRIFDSYTDAIEVATRRYNESTATMLRQK